MGSSHSIFGRPPRYPQNALAASTFRPVPGSTTIREDIRPHIQSTTCVRSRSDTAQPPLSGSASELTEHCSSLELAKESHMSSRHESKLEAQNQRAISVPPDEASVCESPANDSIKRSHFQRVLNSGVLPCQPAFNDRSIPDGDAMESCSDHGQVLFTIDPTPHTGLQPSPTPVAGTLPPSATTALENPNTIPDPDAIDGIQLQTQNKSRHIQSTLSASSLSDTVEPALSMPASFGGEQTSILQMENQHDMSGSTHDPSLHESGARNTTSPAPSYAMRNPAQLQCQQWVNDRSGPEDDAVGFFLPPGKPQFHIDSATEVRVETSPVPANQIPSPTDTRALANPDTIPHADATEGIQPPTDNQSPVNDVLHSTVGETPVTKESRRLVAAFAPDNSTGPTIGSPVRMPAYDWEATHRPVPNRMPATALRRLMGIDPRLPEEEQQADVARVSATVVAAAQLNMQVPWREHKRNCDTDAAVTRIQACFGWSEATIAHVMGDLITHAMGGQEPTAPPQKATTGKRQLNLAEEAPSAKRLCADIEPDVTGLVRGWYTVERWNHESMAAAQGRVNTMADQLMEAIAEVEHMREAGAALRADFIECLGVVQWEAVDEFMAEATGARAQ